MAYRAYVTRLKNLHKHPNADRLQIGECFGNSVVVSMEYTDNQLGIYFPCDGKLSMEFAAANNLLRMKDADGNNVGGYMDPDKRNVTALKLRGERSDGLFLPLESLAPFGDITTLSEGMTIDVWNGQLICEKYVPRKNTRTGHVTQGNRTRKAHVTVAPLFAEHADTEQLAYNLGAFKAGDLIEITLKMHGTSQRTGCLPVLTGYQDSIRCVAGNVLGAIMHRLKDKRGKFQPRHDGAPIYDWGHVSGTRRVVLQDYDGGYYGSNEFREQHSKLFEGKLQKGETVYYEVVGFTHEGKPIMSSCDNKKLQDKEFLQQYGKTTVFSYGCNPSGYVLDPEGETVEVPVSDVYVYRMTMTNEDGDVVEYTPDFMRYRCEQMSVKTVQVFEQFYIPEQELVADADGAPVWVDVDPGQYVLKHAERYFEGPDPVGKTHVREGVVVRIVNRPKFCAYKHKNWFFKALEGLVKITAEAPDMEEAQDVVE